MSLGVAAGRPAEDTTWAIGMPEVPETGLRIRTFNEQSATQKGQNWNSAKDLKRAARNQSSTGTFSTVSGDYELALGVPAPPQTHEEALTLNPPVGISLAYNELSTQHLYLGRPHGAWVDV